MKFAQRKQANFKSCTQDLGWFCRKRSNVELVVCVFQLLPNDPNSSHKWRSRLTPEKVTNKTHKKWVAVVCFKVLWGQKLHLLKPWVVDSVDGSEIPFPTTWDGAKNLVRQCEIYHINWCRICFHQKVAPDDPTFSAQLLFLDIWANRGIFKMKNVCVVGRERWSLRISMKQ